MPFDRAHVTLDVDVNADPIEGSLRGDDGVTRRFTGYMQLVTVLEATLSAARGTEIARVAPASAESSDA